jgi:HlyD family secretion protein
MKDKRKRVAVAAVVGVLAVIIVVWRVFFSGEFLYAGTVEATEVDLSSRVSSVIADLGAHEGDRVKKGQKLVRLAGEDIRLAADLAEKNFRRTAELFKNGSVPQAEYDRVRYVRDDAAVRRSWCEVSSPVDGVVLFTYFEPGEMVAPGMKLLTVADLKEVWTVVYVPQPLLAKLKAGMTVTGILPELKKNVFDGKIAHIREEAEFTPRNVQTRDERIRLVYGVKVVFLNPDGILKPGMTIEVCLPR